MPRKLHPIALGLAMAVNVAALAAVDAAMIEFRAHSQLANLKPARIVVTATPFADPIVAARMCPAPSVL